MNFPVRLSPDRRFLVDGDGAPFLVHGEAAWSLFVQLTREQVEQYVEDRRRRGFNLLMVNLVERHFADDPPRNRYGDAPFVNPGDFSTPNERYFSHVDWVLRRAESAGLAVLLCPAYLGYEGGDEGWYREVLRNGPVKLQSYGRYLGNRYAAFRNIVWLQGGDFLPPAERLNLVDAIAGGIRESDKQHLHTAHWAPEVSAADASVTGWLDLNTTYTYGPVYVKSLFDYRRADRLAHFLIESKYENEPDASPGRLRAQAYYALLTGAVGHVFGNTPVWRFDRGWQDALASPGSISMTHVRALFDSRRWMDLVPDTKNEILVEGMGRFGSMDYALLARASDGTLAIAYVPEVRTLKIDRAKLANPIRAKWYDPTSGRYATAAIRATSTAARVEFTPPGKNSAGDEDWVLVLEK